MNNVDLDTLARKIFGPAADQYKNMANNLSKQDMNNIINSFMSIPENRRKEYLNEVKNSISNNTSKVVSNTRGFRY